MTKKRLLLSLLLFRSLLPCIVPRMVHPIVKMFGEDFNVYFTAALVASHHGGPLIYEGADTGVDPQMRESVANGVFLRTARSVGIPRTQLYLYPPTLADLLIPLTVLSRNHALLVWNLLNVLEAIFTGICLLDLCGVPLRSWKAALIVLGVYIVHPVQAGLAWGQVTTLLMCLWAAGTAAYRRGWVKTSAALFALAGALKLTPFLVVFPFLLWREWRWLRAFAVDIAILVAGMWLINSPATIWDYFHHVVPSMTHGIPQVGNIAVAPALELMWATLRGRLDSSSAMQHVPDVIQARAKVAAMLVMLAMLAVVVLTRKVMRDGRILVLAALAPLSVVTSPVSWGFAYAVVVLPLVILWVAAYREQPGWKTMVFLSVATFAMMTPMVVTLATTLLMRHPGQVLLLCLTLAVVPGSGLALASVCLQRALSDLKSAA